MKSWVLAAVAAVSIAGPASAAVVTLQSTTKATSGNTTFSYQGTLGPDEGLRSGDRLVIYDFAGYVPGSISADGNMNVAVSTENVTTNGVVAPGFIDNPALTNLVFTYTGPDFRNTGGPFAPLDFNNLSAQSTLSGLTRSAFFTLTTKNNPDNVPGGSNTAVYSLGSATTPAAAVPEPATWAMMLGGFGFMGAAMRRRNRVTRVVA